MKVLITIDVECDHKHGYEEMVFCRFGDGTELGIGYISKTLFDYNLKGIFFVEPIGSKKYGLKGLRDAIDVILSYGHEVQLHIHPSFSGGDDAMSSYELNDQVLIIREGKHILEKCGARDVLAFRAGSFSANTDTIKALCKLGIHFDSSYNLNYTNSNCQIEAKGPMNWPFKTGSIFEFPVTCFDWPFHYLRNNCRHMQIGAVGLGEFLDVFSKAKLLNYRFVTILLHSFEFIRKGPKDLPESINVDRFEGLCRFLGAHTDMVNSIGFSDLSKAILTEDFSLPPKPIPTVKLLSWAKRNIEQFRKRIQTITR